MATLLDLRQEPQHIPTLAAWHHAEWSHYYPDDTLEKRIARMQDYLGPDVIPGTFICKHGNTLAGSAALIAHDMETHMELSPWLASVYVAPEFRHRGFGTLLVKHVMHVAAQAGYTQLYLFTPDQESFYARLGWNKIARELFHGETVTLMRATL